MEEATDVTSDGIAVADSLTPARSGCGRWVVIVFIVLHVVDGIEVDVTDTTIGACLQGETHRWRDRRMFGVVREHGKLLLAAAQQIFKEQVQFTLEETGHTLLDGQQRAPVHVQCEGAVVHNQSVALVLDLNSGSADHHVDDETQAKGQHFRVLAIVLGHGVCAHQFDVLGAHEVVLALQMAIEVLDHVRVVDWQLQLPWYIIAVVAALTSITVSGLALT